MALGNESDQQLQWEPKSIEIRTRSVEMALQPLVMKVTTLVNTDVNRKKGKSKRAHILVALVEKAIENFIRNGEIIANENSDIQKDLHAAVKDVKNSGKVMTDTSREFAEDPCSSQKRGNMVRAARALLSAVTRLLILADMVDVQLLLKSLKIVEGDLERLKAATNQAELMDGLKNFGKNANNLLKESGKRQYELRDPQQRDNLAAARALLKKHSTMLLSASKAYLRHPELAAAKANRDFVLRQVCEAVNTISDIARGQGVRSDNKGTMTDFGAGELASALNDLDRNVLIQPNEYNERRMRPSLEQQLESIISGAALMADSSSTRDDRRERIIAECNAVRQALQDLLSEYMNNGGRKDRSENLEIATEHMNKKTKDLRRQLRKAVVDHVCDSFMDATAPLAVLIEAAKRGNEQEVEQYADVFSEHAGKLVEVANLACTMSDNDDGVKMVKFAAKQIHGFCPQVINAAKILAARPKSKPALENMEAFRRAWETQTRILTEAVDDIIVIDDFLGVTENHILEDVNKCIAAVQEQDPETLDRTAGLIQGRVYRVTDVVSSEMNDYEPGMYTEFVLEAVKDLNDHVMPNFVSKVQYAVDSLSSQPPKEVDENEFIDASSRVYDGVREIRRAVLLDRDADELDPEDVVIDERTETGSKISGATSSHGADERSQIRAAIEKLPEEQKEKIQKEVRSFRDEKQKFDREVTKWDDSGNDIIVLAKHMCMIMMEMTDFTWGRGPLKTTMDVINAAKKISELGSKLDKFAREIAEHCPEGSTKKDLLAYIEQIALYCHQLNITSKVKADVQNISGDLIVSGLDSATSLIQAAKNLMTSVVSTVKTSYIASTKYPRQGGGEHAQGTRMVWKMKPPEKKPLVRAEKSDDIRAIVRRGSQKRQTPIQTLSEFTSPTESV